MSQKDIEWEEFEVWWQKVEYHSRLSLYGKKAADAWLAEHRRRCPHCGDPVPFGDERLMWLSAHLDSRVHRLWWRLKKQVKI